MRLALTPSWRRVLRLAAAPLLLTIVIVVAGPAEMARALRGADWRWLLAGLLTAIASNIASAWRWAALARWLGQPVPLGWAVRVYFRAMAVSTLLPGAVVGADVFRAWSLRRRGSPLAEAGTSVLLDRLSGVWILQALGIAGLIVGLDDPRLPALLGLLHLPPGWPTLPWALSALASVLLLPLAVLAGWRASGLGAERLALLHRGGALAQYAFQAMASLIVQLLSVACFAFAAFAFGVELPGWLVAITAVPIFLMAALPVGFGGWGTREAATAACWSVFGVPAALAVGTSIAYGLYAIVQGGLGLLLPGQDVPSRQAPDDERGEVPASGSR